MGQKELPNSSEVGTHSQDEIDSMWIIRLLDWVITYDRSGEVGGQSQAVELRPHGTVRWLKPCLKLKIDKRHRDTEISRIRLAIVVLVVDMGQVNAFLEALYSRITR